MAKTQTQVNYIGLDIGSSKVACVVGVSEEGAATPSIIGVGVAPSVGMRKGIVVDVEETVSAITAAVDEAERISGVVIDRATISVDGAHITSQNSKGVIAVGRADQEISLDDLRRAEEAATAVNLPQNREILQVFPRSYTVDDQTGIHDPVGMRGVRLEVDTHIVTGSTPAMKNLHRAVYQAGIDIAGQTLVPIASAKAVLSKRQREIGVALVDIGGGTTGVAVFEEGDIASSVILPVGAGHITSDIAIGLRTSIETAEKIKIKYADATKTSDKEKIRVEELDGEDSILTRRELSNIVNARLGEIFDLVRAELKKIGKDALLPGGMVLTGGGAKLKGIEEFAKDALKLPVTIGKVDGLSGIAEKVSGPGYTAVIGLMLENMTATTISGAPAAKISHTVDRIKQTLRNLLP